MERGYKGKPENQRNPKARNIHVQKQAVGDGSTDSTHAAVQARKPPLPTQAPRGSKVNTPTPKPSSIVEKDSTVESYFAFNMDIREVRPKVQQQPNLGTYPNLVNLTYNQLSIDDTNLSKQWTRESFQYYATALLWLRIIHLKQKFCDPITENEQKIIEKCANTAFNVPETLRLYLAGIGLVQTRAGQHLYPAFPDLPQEIMDNTPGYFGAINADSHNLYEEIPCLGTIITMLRASLADIRPLPQPVIPAVPNHFAPNRNLCFWHNVTTPRYEATLILTSIGITPQNFPCSPAGTGFNFILMKSVSNILAQTSTFKIHSTVFAVMQQQGQLAQTIPTHPTPENDATEFWNTATVIPRCPNREQPGSFGMAVAFGYQLYKEPFENVNTVWCCVTPINPAAHPIPAHWVLNRNERRILPSQYDLNIFNGMSQNMNDFLNQSHIWSR